MKITKEHVGEKVRSRVRTGEAFVEVLFVGDNNFFCRWPGGSEDSLGLDSDWELYEEPKPKTLVAPAMVKDINGKRWRPTLFFYDNLDDAKSCNLECSSVIWPAIPNKDGFYEV